MRKIHNFFKLFIVFLLFSVFLPQNAVYAAECGYNIQPASLSQNNFEKEENWNGNNHLYWYSIDIDIPEQNLNSDNFMLQISGGLIVDQKAESKESLLDYESAYYIDVTTNTLTVQIGNETRGDTPLGTAFTPGDYVANVYKNSSIICDNQLSWTISPQNSPTPTWTPTPKPLHESLRCDFSFDPSLETVNNTDTVYMVLIETPTREEAEELVNTTEGLGSRAYGLELITYNSDGQETNTEIFQLRDRHITTLPGNDAFIVPVRLNRTLEDNFYEVRVGSTVGLRIDNQIYCSEEFAIGRAQDIEPILPPDEQDEADAGEDLKRVCDSLSGDEKAKCEACVAGEGDYANRGNGAYTALGCLPTSPAGFVSVLFNIGIGIGGGIAFLLMLWGSFQILTSSGDPQRIQQGREIIVSAVIGLLLIIFAVAIMRFISVDALKIPGFGPTPTLPPNPNPASEQMIPDPGP